MNAIYTIVFRTCHDTRNDDSCVVVMPEWSGDSKEEEEEEEDASPSLTFMWEPQRRTESGPTLDGVIQTNSFPEQSLYSNSFQFSLKKQRMKA